MLCHRQLWAKACVIYGAWKAHWFHVRVGWRILFYIWIATNEGANPRRFTSLPNTWPSCEVRGGRERTHGIVNIMSFMDFPNNSILVCVLWGAVKWNCAEKVEECHDGVMRGAHLAGKYTPLLSKSQNYSHPLWEKLWHKRHFYSKLQHEHKPHLHQTKPSCLILLLHQCQALINVLYNKSVVHYHHLNLH